MTVLDVAAGNGNVAIEAARRGAKVTASDLTPSMVEMGRARSEAEGLPITWLEADAEELALSACSFDVVTSAFGAIFAPRPERVAAELFRVARPGGLVAMANYTSRGFLAAFAELISDFATPAPISLPSPFRWGDEAEVRRRFDGLASSIEVRPCTAAFEFGSTAEALGFMERTNGGQLALRSLLPEERYREVVGQSERLVRQLNASRDGRTVLEFEYLIVLARA
ncbi:MAG TPA: class I SAM-dependent methyltransferase [Candidatus Dormibacteraeota bacterium]|nr:class I SAM-dependent methyltransferase [Candidatus Dormibacteraeota bacterium]